MSNARVESLPPIEQEFVDRKRHAWLLSVVYPLFPVAAVAAHALTGQEWWFITPLLLAYGLVPLLDHALGEDPTNPPESKVAELEADHYYRLLTWLTVPGHVLALIVAVAYATTAGLSWAGWLLLVLITGLASGLAINTAHEMGHKKGRVDQWLARLALAVPVYGHFTTEHNFGHHKDVATPGDSASARMGESVYRFALRDMPGGLTRAWRIESQRLARRGRSRWSLHSTIVQSWLMSLILQGSLILLLGWPALAFLLIHNLVAWFQLTSANYVEHYGLLRARDADGCFERCQPHHSWNSNHIASNLLLFHLERHSDHHANPARSYQSLRDFENVPRLPSGYFGMFLLAWVPPLWFRVMDPRLLALPHVQGDRSRINRG